jgi:hypothetical protein
MRTGVSKNSLMVAGCVLASVLTMAQQDNPPSVPILDDERPISVLSGGLAFVPIWEAGNPTLVSIFSPVLLLPLGSKFIFESRAAFEGDFQRRNGNSGDFTGAIAKSVDYMEFDYIGNKFVTITGGRFLTPFNIFNERFYPNWIRDIQTDPLIFPIGTGSDNGVMVRGGVAVEKDVTINYAVYFSALSTANHFESERHAGLRASIFLPRERFEIGTSLQRRLQDERFNRYGLHMQWQPRRIPFDVRAEGAYSSKDGNGMWIEAAFRNGNASSELLRRTQPVARTQLFHTGNVGAGVDAKRTEIGVNYYLNDGWKALASYGRTFTDVGDSNIWTIGMTYRFVMPLGPTQ